MIGIPGYCPILPCSFPSLFQHRAPSPQVFKAARSAVAFLAPYSEWRPFWWHREIVVMESSLTFLQLGVAGLIVAGTVCLLIRQVEVRLVLLGSGLLMATIAGNPLAIVDTFAQGMVANLVAPICAAMGF